MKRKKITALLLALLLVAASFATGTVSVGAVTYSSDENFDYALNSDGTYSLYRYHGELTELSLPESFEGRNIVGIMGYCFLNSDISSVTIPECYTSIGELAFFGCTSLEEVVIPSSVGEIGAMAFNGCTSLESINMSACSVTEIPYAFCTDSANLTSVLLPDSVTVIGELAFCRTGLTSIEFPASLRTIEESAFDGCASLSGVTFPDGLETIGAGAFHNATSLGEVYIPAAVTSIGEDAFKMDDDTPLTIGCVEGSYAETYCTENNIAGLNASLLGDVDNNGEVDINDATLIQLYRIDKFAISGTPMTERSDANRDGEITLRDATVVQMIVARVI